MNNPINKKNSVLKVLNLTFGSLGFALGCIPFLDLASVFLFHDLKPYVHDLANIYFDVFLSKLGYFGPIIGVLFCVSTLIIGLIGTIVIEEKKERAYLFVGVILGTLGITGNLISFLYFLD